MVGRSGVGGRKTSPVGSALAAGEATAADYLIFVNNFVAGDEGDAAAAAMTMEVSAAALTATAGPLATAAV